MIKRIIVFNVFITLSLISFTQEICNNGIDDDFDGLIDLNDPDCSCSGIGGGSTNVTSLIPNSSFEDMNCCPNTFSMLNCAVSWQQASGATSDYFNTCNYTGGTGGLQPMPQPLPNGGAGAAGFFSNNNWEENIGTCLNSPMLTGTEYTITLNIAQSMGSQALNLTIYGTPNCGDLPWGGTGCPVGIGGWQVLSSQNLTLTTDVWTSVTLVFTPSVDINAISIGGPCGGQAGGNNYYYIDDLTLNTSASFAGATITPAGQWCDNNLNLTASTTATGGSWQWYLNGVAISGETSATINANTYGVGMYSAVYDDGTACEQVDYTVNLPPYPSSNFTATQVCELNPTQFTDNSTITGGNIINYLWDFGNGNTSNAQNPTFNFGGAGTFPVSLTTTSDSNCTNTYTTNVIVNPNPQPNATVTINGISYPTDGSVTIEACLYDILNFNDLTSIAPPDNITTYTWDFGDGNTSNQQSPSYNYANPGTYNVVFTVQSNNTCSQSITFPVTINPIPVAGFTANNVCQYNAAIFNNSSNVSTGVISSNFWDFDDGNSSTNINPSNNYNSEGIYNVSLLVISDKGCRDSITQPITIYEVPQASFTLIDSCEYDAVAFNNQSSINTGTISNFWDFGDGNTSTTINPSHFYMAGNYVSELLVISDNGCRDSITQPVNVYAKPNASMSFNNECENIAVIFNDLSTVTADVINAWNWDFGDGSTDLTNQNVNHIYSADGQYVVELIVSSANGCLDTATQNITIYPEPNTSFTTNNVCLYDNAIFTDASTVVNPYTISNWSWDFGDGNTSTNSLNVNHQYNVAGTYLVSLTTTSANGCSSSFSSNIEIYPIPVADFTSTEVCINEPPTIFTDLSTVSSGNVVGWNWNFNQVGTSSLQHPNFTFNTNSNVTTTLIVESNFGCLDTITKPVVVFEKPQAQFSSDVTQVCNPGSINFFDGSSSNSTTITAWDWNFFNGTTSNEMNPVVNYVNETEDPVFIDVELIATNSFGCKDTLLVDNYITVIPTPIAQFYSQPSLLTIQDSETEFVNQSQLSDEYLWDFGDGSETSIEENPTHEYPSIQETYVVELIAYNYNQFCSDTAHGTVIVKDIIIFYVPNIFTPDNDDFNQVWNPTFTSGVDIYDFHLIVFNRWGETVWESYNPSATWNGMYGGKLVQDGVYVWKLEFKETMSDKRHNYTGHVTILK